MPLRDWEHKTAYFGPGRFTYDPEAHVYHCPAGHLLRPSKTKWKAEKIEYQADVATCTACPLNASCTSSSQGRQLHRSFHAAAMERVKRTRRVWAEPLFAEAKQWHGLSRFRLRGVHNVNIEGVLIAAGQNLKRFLAKQGWGKHWGPNGPLMSPSVAEIGIPFLT